MANPRRRRVRRPRREWSEAVSILALDPSSTCCGYCLAEPRVGYGMRCIEAGVIKPTPRKGTALERADRIASYVAALVAETPPAEIVIEIPAMRPPRHARGMATRGQANYGLAVGLILSAARAAAYPRPVHTVTADTWTRTAKAKRLGAVMATVPTYDPATDPGMDMADAILLARWWMDNH